MCLNSKHKYTKFILFSEHKGVAQYLWEGGIPIEGGLGSRIMQISALSS